METLKFKAKRLYSLGQRPGAVEKEDYIGSEEEEEEHNHKTKQERYRKRKNIFIQYYIYFTNMGDQSILPVSNEEILSLCAPKPTETEVLNSPKTNTFIHINFIFLGVYNATNYV